MAREALLRPGERVQEFVIARELGAGGFGVTYLARDINFERLVALKEYFPVEYATRRSDGKIGPRSQQQVKGYRWGLKRFLQEARTLDRLAHPNIVRVRRVFEERGTAYLVTDYVEGRSLKEELGGIEGRAWPEARVRGLMEGLVDGLAHVHEAGLVHRDIKPANVMVRADGKPVLIDFGAVKGPWGTRSRSTMQTRSAGYSAIEQYGSESEQGTWTDVYAVGAVAYRALTGKRPAQAPDRVSRDPLVDVRRAARGPVSAGFGSAVMAALAVREEDRPQSVSAWRALWDVEPPGPVPEAGNVEIQDESQAEEHQFGSILRLDSRSDLSRKTTAASSNHKWKRGLWGLGFGTVLAAVLVGLLFVDRLDSLLMDRIDFDGEAASAATTPEDRDPPVVEPDRDPPVVEPDRDPPVVEPDDQAVILTPEQLRRLAEAAENALGLDRETRRLIQLGLAAEEFDSGGSDGTFGPRTRAGTGEWQRGRGAGEPTGYLDEEEVRLLTAAGRVLPYSRELGRQWSAISLDANGWTDLHYAAVLDGSDVAWRLLAAGASRDARLHSDGSPVSVFLEDALTGAVPSLAAMSHEGQTPLHMAAAGDAAGVIQVLLDRGADVEASTLDVDARPLHYAAQYGALGAVRLLLDRGADVDARDAGGGTALHRAAEGAHVPVVRILRERGADAAVRDRRGRTPGGLTDDEWLRARLRGIDPAMPARCARQLGRLSRRTYTRNDTLGGRCRSVHQAGGEPAVYYGFTLDRPAVVTVLMSSLEVDSRLAFRDGAPPGAADPMDENDDYDGVLDAGGSTLLDSRVSRSLAPGSYTIEATALEEEAGAFTLTVTVAGAGGNVDDHGDTEASATRVVPGRPVPGAIEAPDDVDFFVVEVRARRRLEVRTTGGTDTIGELYGNGRSLNSDDDGGGGTNFRISQTVAPGTYYVRVSGYGSETGSYRLEAVLE